MRILIAALLLAAADARADAVAEILDQLKLRIEKAEKLADGKSRAPLKEELRAMRVDIERAQKVLATPTVPPPPTVNPLPMPPPPPRVSLAGKVELAQRCTQRACGAANPCCNQCVLVVHLTPDDGPFARRQILVESGHGCSIDGCGKLSGCALKHGERARLADVIVSCSDSECTARK